MIVKVIGVCDGVYREKVYDHVRDYTFTNSGMPLAEQVYKDMFSESPFSHLYLTFDNRDPVSFSFNTKAFIMEENGRTIDVLKFDPRKEQ